jgi:hypothetical protein
LVSLTCNDGFMLGTVRRTTADDKVMGCVGDEVGEGVRDEVVEDSGVLMEARKQREQTNQKEEEEEEEDVSQYNSSSTI